MRIDKQGMTHTDKAVPAIVLTSVVLAMVGLCCTVLSLMFEEWQPTFSHFTMPMLGWIVASAVVGTAMRFLLQTHAQSLSTNTHSVVILVIEPVWVALLAAAWFGERMNMQQLVGCLLIFAALLISRMQVLRGWIKSVC